MRRVVCAVLAQSHLLELLRVEPLHFNNLIVARAVVERIGSVGEVIDDVASVKMRNDVRVVP